MRIRELLEKRDLKSESIGLATAWLKSNFKSYGAPFKVMRVPTSGNYIMATSATNPGWDKPKRVYVEVTGQKVKQVTVQRWNEVVELRRATKVSEDANEA